MLNNKYNFVKIYLFNDEVVLMSLDVFVALLGTVNLEDELVDVNRRLVGMRVGVLSSLLNNDRVEPCLLDGRDPLGVTLERIGIDVLRDGVLLSLLNKLSQSESVRDFDERSCVYIKKFELHFLHR